MKKLNLGCGMDVKQGWVNLDSASLPGVDVAHNLDVLPLPFEDEVFDEILCQDVLEHVNLSPLLSDLHRILKKGGLISVRVPHFTSKNAYTDPTHRNFFAVRTFDFFLKSAIKGRGYYFGFAFDKMREKKITFERSARLFFYNRFVSFFVNKSTRTQYIYESTFLSRLFPAENIVVTLQK
ncbi:MAG: methyltransferase domain-containing protein [bacterium]|nr:methyltransferase domain-containing protein [bacterium]